MLWAVTGASRQKDGVPVGRCGASEARGEGEPGAGRAPLVHLVSCVAKKALEPTPARELYRSPWFQKARAYVERQGGPWYILSARYGLLHPDRVVAPYDETLAAMPASARRAWARRVEGQLEAEGVRARRLVVLAGSKYRQFLMPALHRVAETVEVPMAGLRIGEQLAWLARHR